MVNRTAQRGRGLVRVSGGKACDIGIQPDVSKIRTATALCKADVSDVKTMVAVIVAAIKRRHIVEVGYRDARRLIEPCCLGTNYHRRWLLWGWQVSRYSGWRTFHVEEFIELRGTGKLFSHGRCGFDYSPPEMTLVHARM